MTTLLELAADLRRMGESPSSVAYLTAHPELVPEIPPAVMPVSQRDGD